MIIGFLAKLFDAQKDTAHHWHTIFCPFNLLNSAQCVEIDFGQNRQGDTQSILHTNRCLGNKGNRYVPFFAGCAFVLWICTVCSDDSHPQK